MKIKAFIGYLIAYPTGITGYLLYHLGAFLHRCPVLSHPIGFLASLFLGIAEVAKECFIEENMDYVLT